MKKTIGIYIVAGLSIGVNFQNKSEAQTEVIIPKFNFQTGIEGEWQKAGAGFDTNNNGTLDDSEIKNDKGLSGYDYFHFYANGKCVFDKDVKFDGTYVIKPDKYNKKAIFIYGSGMPPGLSQKEKDGAAYVYRIKSIEEKRLVLAPAHLSGKLVLYKRL
jgi:hypothetical protein